MKQRLDKLLLDRGLADTQQRSQGLILSGKVLVAGQRVDKAGTMVADDAAITLIGGDIQYVSRGGLKLKAAVDEFGLDFHGLVCADIGASTGGFTDCLLQEGAAKVFAIDVGYGLLDLKVRNNPRVVVIERTNVRHMTPEVIGGELADAVVIDVSFISLRLVMGAVLSILKPGGTVVSLVKPQFEVSRENVGKGGIVRDEGARLRALEEIKEFMPGIGLEIIDEMESPTRGAKGNIEYLLYMRKAR